MKRTAGLWLLLLSGCSTAPLADLLDFFKPGRIRPGAQAATGGVCIPQGGQVVPPAAVPALPPAPVGVQPVPLPEVPPAPVPSVPGGVIPPPGPPAANVPPTQPF